MHTANMGREGQKEGESKDLKFACERFCGLQACVSLC